MDRSGDENSAPMTTLMATDADGRMLHCFLEESIPIQGQSYGLLSPVDTPAHLCRWLPDPVADPEFIADPYQCPQVLDALDTALQEQELCLVRSAGMLTVAGDLENTDLDTELDDAEEVPIDANGLQQEGTADDDDLDTYILLASICHGGTEFGLYGSLDPCFLLARLGQGTAELLAPDTLAKLKPLVEEALAHDGEVRH